MIYKRAWLIKLFSSLIFLYLVSSRYLSLQPNWWTSNWHRISCKLYLGAMSSSDIDTVLFVKPQQWPTPSESIAIYCVRKLVSCITHLQSCAKVDIWNKKKKVRTVAKIKTQGYKIWRLPKFSTNVTLPLNTATTLFNEPRSQRQFPYAINCDRFAWCGSLLWLYKYCWMIRTSWIIERRWEQN